MISIIIPIYNVEKYLERCMISITNQTYKNLEILLIDDGSTDLSYDICDFWKKKDHRIVVIHKNNGGLSDARNVGINNAHGEYISFIDSDDYVSVDMYQILLDTMERNNADIVICGKKEISDNKCISHSKPLKKSEIIYDNANAIGELLSGYYIDESAYGKLYKKEIFTERFPVGEINEDIVTIPKVFDNAKRIVLIDKQLYHYCRRENSITTNRNYAKKLIVRQHIKDVSKAILEEHPNLKEEVSIFKGRYSLSELFTFFDEPRLIEKYNDYFTYYLTNLKENVAILLTSEKISLKRKIEIIMILLGVYKYYCCIRNILKSNKGKL